MKKVKIKASEIKKYLGLDKQFPTEEFILEIFVDSSISVTYPIDKMRKQRNRVLKNDRSKNSMYSL